MDRATILKPTRCDLKRLPLDAREAFVLSQLDGQLTLDDLAQVAGLDFIEAARLARKLVELGAVTVIESPPKKRRLPANVMIVEKDDARPTRIDPRAERLSIPRMEKVSVSSPVSTQARRISRKMRALSSARVESAEEPCELDAAKQEEIKALDAALETADFYAALGVARDADKKAIKRAYFALAAKFHPDRFFGKKLGKLRPVIDRIFKKLTLANDTLLAHAAAAPRASKAPPRSSRTPSSPPRASKSPAAPRSTKSPRRQSRASSASRKMKKVSTKVAAVEAIQAQSSVVLPQRSEERLKQLHQAAREAKLQGKIDMFLEAAEEALRRDDVIGAANNYRLALEHREDKYVRAKLDDVDARAKTVRFTRAMTQGRAAEREQRWSDAAMHYTRGYEARPTAEIAERAGNALLRSNGDLAKAASLVERAVEIEPDNLSFHITLGEIYLTSNRLDEAEEAAEAALELSSSSTDARAKALAAAVAKRQKAARH